MLAAAGNSPGLPPMTTPEAGGEALAAGRLGCGLVDRAPRAWVATLVSAGLTVAMTTEGAAPEDELQATATTLRSKVISARNRIWLP